MRCPYCGRAETRVVDTASHLPADEIRRRRECLECHRRFTTVERVQMRLPLVVKDGPEGLPARREAFDANKLRQGIHIACAKRPIPQAAIDRLVEAIEAQLEESNLTEISSRTIGEWVITGLRDLDEIAYLRYAIVFMGLDDLVSVRREMDRLLAEHAVDPGPT
jgi:transcriptional repressor NrdR